MTCDDRSPTLRTRPTWRASMPATRALMIWGGAVYGLGLVVIFVLIMRAGFTAASMRWLIGLNVLVVPVWIGLPLTIARDRRRTRRFGEAGFAHCLRCGYDLTGLPEGGSGAHQACPECAQPYDLVATRCAWEHALRHSPRSTHLPKLPPTP